MPSACVQQGRELLRIPHRCPFFFPRENVDLPDESLDGFRPPTRFTEMLFQGVYYRFLLRAGQVNPGSPRVLVFQLDSELEQEAQRSFLVAAYPWNKRIARELQKLVDRSGFSAEVSDVLDRLDGLLFYRGRQERPVQALKTPRLLVLEVSDGAEYSKVYEVDVAPIHCERSQECAPCPAQLVRPGDVIQLRVHLDNGAEVRQRSLTSLVPGSRGRVGHMVVRDHRLHSFDLGERATAEIREPHSVRLFLRQLLDSPFIELLEEFRVGSNACSAQS